jgi:hypothetical protein
MTKRRNQDSIQIGRNWLERRAWKSHGFDHQWTGLVIDLRVKSVTITLDSQSLERPFSRWNEGW